MGEWLTLPEAAAQLRMCAKSLAKVLKEYRDAEARLRTYCGMLSP